MRRPPRCRDARRLPRPAGANTPCRTFPEVDGSILKAVPLGLPIVEKTPFALVAYAGDTMLRLTVVERPAAAPYTVLGWRVADIASVIDQLTDSGVAFTRYEGMEQDERGVWTAPAGAKVALFPDPDGNHLSLTEFPTSWQAA